LADEDKQSIRSEKKEKKLFEHVDLSYTEKFENLHVTLLNIQIPQFSFHNRSFG